MYTIGRLAHRAGVTADSIRFYERKGLLRPATKTASGYHLYDTDALRRLAFIKEAQRCGFNLAEINELLDTSADDERARAGRTDLAKRKLVEVRQSMEALARMERALLMLLEAPAEPPKTLHDVPIIIALETVRSAE